MRCKMFAKLCVLCFLTNLYLVRGDCCAEIVKNENCQIVNTDHTLSREINSTQTQDGKTLLSFYVKAAENATIILKDSPDLEHTIVLGTKQDNDAEIMINSNTEDENYAMTCNETNIISKQEWRGFWIEIINSKPSIKVGKKGEKKEFLHYNIPSTMNVTEYYFSAGKNSSVKWAFGCTNDDDGKFFKQQKKIRQCQLLQNNDKSPPNFVTKYKTSIEMHADKMNFTLENGIFHLEGKAVITWHDERLRWNEEDDFNEYVPSFEHNSTWKPDIIVVNSDIVRNKPFSSGKTIVSNEGILMWIACMNITTKCNIDIKNWPWDAHNCSINLKLNTDAARFHLPVIKYPVTEDWIVTKNRVSNFPTVNNPLTIEILLQRKATLYQQMFLYQFIVTSAILLCSLAISPSRGSKMVINLISFLLLAFLFYRLNHESPQITSPEPELLNQYNTLFSIGALSSCLSIYFTRIASKSRKSHPWQFVLSVIDNRVVRLVLFLTFHKKSEKYEYENDREMKDLRAQALGEHVNSENTPENVSKNSRINAAQRDWVKVAVAVDHLFFITCCYFIGVVSTNFARNF